MSAQSRYRRWILPSCFLAVLLISIGWVAPRGEDSAITAEERHSNDDVGESGPRERTRRHYTMERWQRAMESALGEHEARRSRIIARKQTVDSELYLLAVEPPSDEEISAIRQKLERLESAASPADEAERRDALSALIRDYDPYGELGRRVIQIDVPDEPNGRLTGFICDAPDIGEMARRFRDGEMTDLVNLRGYSAAYAGMPLKRFDALLVDE